MKRKMHPYIWTALLTAAFLLCLSVLPAGADAATVEDLTYEIKNNEVIITDCDIEAEGKLVIPEKIGGYPVTTIAEYAFYNCQKLTDITIADSVTTIEEWAFHYCIGLKSMTIPKGVTVINQCLFCDCTGLTQVILHDQITAIEDGAFTRCSALQSIQIPASVTSITDNFSSCDALKSIEVAENNTKYSSDANGVLFNKKKTTLLRGPGALTGHYVIPQGVKKIADEAFMYCHKLTGVTIPESVTSIGMWAFSGSENLQQITIPDSVTSVGYWAFCSCTGLESVTIGNGLTVVDEDVFCACTGLKRVILGSSVKQIGFEAFYNCTALETLCFTGTKEQWNEVVIDGSNVCLRSVDLYLNYIPVEITQQPVNQSAPAGKIARFAVGATGTGLNYQWQYRVSSKGVWKNATATGSKKATIAVNVTAAKNGFQYRCAITDSCGITYYSNIANLKVLRVTLQPVNRYLPAGKTAVFTVKANGYGLKYQWQYRTPVSTRWLNSPATGNKTATLKVPATAGRDGYQYRCRITDKNGNVIYSDAAMLKLVTLKIVIQPADKTLTAGKTALFTVKANGTELTYQWQYRTSATGKWMKATATGNKTARLRVPATVSRNGYQYRCMITDVYGNVIYSNAAKLTVK